MATCLASYRQHRGGAAGTLCVVPRQCGPGRLVSSHLGPLVKRVPLTTPRGGRPRQWLAEHTTSVSKKAGNLPMSARGASGVVGA
ncbi:MAG: hypothetical protein MI748_02945, partial [Opitutales bacterium]|nr:hypothetical protein [Opitutales bacterium]